MQPCWLLLIALVAPSLSAEPRGDSALTQVLRLAGTHSGDTAPGPGRLAASPARAQQLPFFREVMAAPLDAPARAASLARSFAKAKSSPLALMRLTGELAGWGAALPRQEPATATGTAMARARDPLAASLAWMDPMASRGGDWPPILPDMTQLPNPLRQELALVLSAMPPSHRFLQRALARLPATATPALLRRQALDGEFLDAQEPDYREMLELVEREALLAGMLHLIAAVERLEEFVRTAPDLPVLAWTLDTPMGQILVDTTGRDNHHRIGDALLVLDVGGNDRYEFLGRGESHRIGVLLDHGGDDRYETNVAGADPSSATLGYGILWDSEGNDFYRGTQQAQASALFGVALLVDGGGNNEFMAGSHAQAHAVGGLALLLSAPGEDRFTAQTHAQASAGPQAVAVLLDPAGNDHYALNNAPLVHPSPQLPGRNTSMGQGAGRGIRAEPDGRPAAGGIGVLLDLGGNDRYEAQVFAQGAGYFQGLGLLVDGGGNDRFDAAWYAMGAAAHQAAGLLLKRGAGDDRYGASHSISLGAAHDFSVGVFLDEGGNDRYEVGDLGLGAAHDNSTALFVDAAGDDVYSVANAACRALGATRISEPGSSRDELPNLGLFMDLGGRDSYPAHCARAGSDSTWTSRRTRPGTHPRSEAGAGIDGEWPLPFTLRRPSGTAAPGGPP